MSMLLRRAMMGSGTVISYDPYFEQVIALLHMEGTNGGTVFTDSSNIAATYAQTSSTTSTAAYKFGTSSAYLGGTTAYVLSGTNVTCNGDFTAEVWAKRNSVGTNAVIWSHGAITGSGYEVYFNAGNNYIEIYGNGGMIMTATSGAVTADGNFHHVAITRTGVTWKAWVDGALCGTSTPTFFVISGTPVLGYNGYTGNQYLDELRITANTARYTTTFTPPTAAFPNSSNQAYTTWNPSDKTGAGSLSNGNLTATGSVGTRGTLSKTSGKWYFETTVSSVTCYIGIQASTASLTNVGDAANSIDYNTSGEIGQSSTYTPVASATTNDVIGVAFDVTANTVTFYKNGTSLWTGSAGITGAVYPWVYASSGACVTNFGATPFKYTIPAGYNPGLF